MPENNYTFQDTTYSEDQLTQVADAKGITLNELFTSNPDITLTNGNGNGNGDEEVVDIETQVEETDPPDDKKYTFKEEEYTYTQLKEIAKAKTISIDELFENNPDITPIGGEEKVEFSMGDSEEFDALEKKYKTHKESAVGEVVDVLDKVKGKKLAWDKELGSDLTGKLEKTEADDDVAAFINTQFENYMDPTFHPNEVREVVYDDKKYYEEKTEDGWKDITKEEFNSIQTRSNAQKKGIVNKLAFKKFLKGKIGSGKANIDKFTANYVPVKELSSKALTALEGVVGRVEQVNNGDGTFTMVPDDEGLTLLGIRTTPKVETSFGKYRKGDPTKPYYESPFHGDFAISTTPGEFIGEEGDIQLVYSDEDGNIIVKDNPNILPFYQVLPELKTAPYLEISRDVDDYIKGMALNQFIDHVFKVDKADLIVDPNTGEPVKYRLPYSSKEEDSEEEDLIPEGKIDYNARGVVNKAINHLFSPKDSSGDEIDDEENGHYTLTNGYFEKDFNNSPFKGYGFYFENRPGMRGPTMYANVAFDQFGEPIRGGVGSYLEGYGELLSNLEEDIYRPMEDAIGEKWIEDMLKTNTPILEAFKIVNGEKYYPGVIRERQSDDAEGNPVWYDKWDGTFRAIAPSHSVPVMDDNLIKTTVGGASGFEVWTQQTGNYKGHEEDIEEIREWMKGKETDFDMRYLDLYDPFNAADALSDMTRAMTQSNIDFIEPIMHDLDNDYGKIKRLEDLVGKNLRAVLPMEVTFKAKENPVNRSRRKLKKISEQLIKLTKNPEDIVTNDKGQIEKINTFDQSPRFDRKYEELLATEEQHTININKYNEVVQEYRKIPLSKWTVKPGSETEIATEYGESGGAKRIEGSSGLAIKDQYTETYITLISPHSGTEIVFNKARIMGDDGYISEELTVDKYNKSLKNEQNGINAEILDLTSKLSFADQLNAERKKGLAVAYNLALSNQDRLKNRPIKSTLAHHAAYTVDRLSQNAVNTLGGLANYMFGATRFIGMGINEMGLGLGELQGFIGGQIRSSFKKGTKGYQLAQKLMKKKSKSWSENWGYNTKDIKKLQQGADKFDKDLHAQNERWFQVNLDDEWETQFNNSMSGKIYGTFIDMVYDLVMMAGMGGGTSGGAGAFKTWIKSGVGQKVKGAAKWGINVNTPMFLRSTNMTMQRMTAFEKGLDMNGEPLDDEVIDRYKGMSYDDKLIYAMSTNWVISKLDKIGLDALSAKGGDKVADWITGKIIQRGGKGLNSQTVTKIFNQEVRALTLKGVIRPVVGTGAEIITENLQEIFQWGAEDLMNVVMKWNGAKQGKDASGFSNPDWNSAEMWREIKELSIISAVAGGPIGVFHAVSQTIGEAGELKNLEKLNSQQFELSHSNYTVDNMTVYRAEKLGEIAELPIDFKEGRITKKQMDEKTAAINKEIENQEKVFNAMQQIDYQLNSKDKQRAFELMMLIEGKNDQLKKINPENKGAGANLELEIKAAQEELKRLSEKVLVVGDLGSEYYGTDLEGTPTIKKTVVREEYKSEKVKKFEASLKEGSNINKIIDQLNKEGVGTNKGQYTTFEAAISHDVTTQIENIDPNLSAEEKIKKENEIIDQAVEEVKNFKSENLKILVVEDSTEAKDLGIELEGQASYNPNNNTIILNKKDIIMLGTGREKEHEIFHHVLFDMLNNSEDGAVLDLQNAINKELKKVDANTIADSDFVQRLDLYLDSDKEIKAEETLTLLSDALANKDIEFKETFWDKINNKIRRLIQNTTGAKIKFENTEAAKQFVKDYNTSVAKGKFTKAQLKAFKEGVEIGEELKTEVEEKVDETPTKPGQRESKTKKKTVHRKKFGKKKLDEIQSSIDEQIDSKAATLVEQKKLHLEKTDKAKEKMKENAPKIKASTFDIQNLQDIKTIRGYGGRPSDIRAAEKRLLENTGGIRTQIARSITGKPQYFTGIAPEAAMQGMGVNTYAEAKQMYQKTLEDDLGIMIVNEWDPTLDPDIERFTRNRGHVRAHDLAGNLGVVDVRKIEGGVGITKDITEAYGVATDEDLIGDLDKTEGQKAYLIKDHLPGAENVYNKMKTRTKGFDTEGKTYKQTPRVALKETIAMFMDNPKAVYTSGVVKGDNILESIVKKIENLADLNKQDLAILKPYLKTALKDNNGDIIYKIDEDGEILLNENGDKVPVLVADILQEGLPDGTTPGGTATGVENVLLNSPLYTKGGRVKKKRTGSAAGLPVQVKQKMSTEEFIKLFDKGGLMKALIVQTDRILTNQAVREGRPTDKIGEGRSEIMASKSIKPKGIAQLQEIASAQDINAAIGKLGIKNVTVTNKNREEKIGTTLEFVKEGKIGSVIFEHAKLGNFGRFGRKGKLSKDGKFIPLSPLLGGKKYYKTKDGKWIEKTDPRANLKYEGKDKITNWLPAKGSLYYGTTDPNYKTALIAAEKNDNSPVNKRLNEINAKRITLTGKPITAEFIRDNEAQSEINMEVLKLFAVGLQDAVHKHGMPIENAALFVTGGYQATTGIIKIAAPFRYVSKGKHKSYREEHNPPASVIGASLIWGIQNNAVKAIMPKIKENYYQTQLALTDDAKLDAAKLSGTLPKGFSILDNSAIRLAEAGINLNSLINPLTDKSLAEELGVGVDIQHQNDPNVIQIQNNLIKEKLQGEKINEKKTLKAYLPIANSKNNARKKSLNELQGSEVKSENIYSESTSNEVIRELGILDKALQIARKPDAPIKKIRVFDFDDTLAKTNSKVFYTMPNGDEGILTAEEFAKRGTDLQEEGAKFDFSDFDKVVEGKKGPLFEVAKIIADKRGTDDVFVLTARGPNSAPAIREFLASLGLDIPVKNITGLGDSSPLAKSGWIVDKAAEGYNDFYFADDHTGNVNAVKKVLNVVDVKSKVQQAKIRSSKNISQIFNDIIENKTGIEATHAFSAAKAKVRGRKKGKFQFFLPPSAEDFVGLLYKTLGKGELGNSQKAWYKDILLDPYARAMNNIAADERGLVADYKKLKAELKGKGIPKNLNKKAIGDYTYSDVARILAWDKQNIKIAGLSKTDLANIKKFAEKNPGIDVFAQQLIDINKESGYTYPGKDWLVGTITTDLMNGLNTTKRQEYLSEWKENVDKIFSEQNLNKLEAAFGSKYREALENMLDRMYSGKNRTGTGSRVENQLLEYLNNSVGAVMFFNMRSAALQTISAVNFTNWTFNNPAKMAAAFANQPQYWKDFMELMNSDFLVTRRNGLRINVSESEIMDAAATSKNKAKAAINYILKKGFIPTQFADSFAIASGGATFYRNRINDLINKEGMSEADAKVKAMEEFREIAEESQQSSRPDRISQQQASGIGRVVLAFANTPTQYARMMKKATLDLVNGRGDWKENLSKIAYYGFVQNLIFNALQQAIFAWGWDDEDDDDKTFNIANGMLDSILRGLGWGGALVAALKNVGVDAYQRLSDPDPGFKGMELWKSGLKMLDFSPPIDVKISKLMRAGSNWEFNAWKPEAKNPFDIDNPAYKSIALVIAATTNIPVDRLFQKVENVRAALEADQENWKRFALIMGWPEWQLESSIEREERLEKQREEKRNLRAIDKVSIYNKEEQEDILKQYGLSQEEIDKLKNEGQRVETIEKLREKKDKIYTPNKKDKQEIKDEIEEVTDTKTFTTPKTFDKTKSKRKKIKLADRTIQQLRLYKLKKGDQIDTLKSLGLSNSQIENLRYEEDRVRKIEELYEENK